MSDSIGALSLPVAAPTAWPPLDKTLAPGDPALLTLGSFAATVLQADCGPAWEVLGGGKPVIVDAVDGTRDGDTAARSVYFSDPRLGYFAPENLPSLFVYRSEKGVRQRWSADFYRRKGAIGIAWLPPRVEEDLQRRALDPFYNAIATSLERAFIFCRHASWVTPADATDGDGLLVSPVASPLVETTITSFDGALAASTTKPGRPVQIITSAAVGAYNTTDPIEVTGILDSGVTFTDNVYLTNANGGETLVGLWSFRPITQIVIPAQLLSTGAFTFGFYQSPDVKLGSLVQRATGFVEMRQREGAVKDIQVKRPNAQPIPFRGFEMLLDVTEELTIDLAVHAELYDPDVAPGLDANFLQGNFDPFNSFSL